MEGFYEYRIDGWRSVYHLFHRKFPSCVSQHNEPLTCMENFFFFFYIHETISLCTPFFPHGSVEYSYKY